MLIEIKDNLIKDIKEYCILNKFDDWLEFTNRLLYKGFMVSKYGVSPFSNKMIERNGTEDFSQQKNKIDGLADIQETEPKQTVEPKGEEKENLLPEQEKKTVVKKKRIIKRTSKND